MSRIIGLLQVDSTVGDLAGNAKRLESLANTAKINGAKLAVATELAICGYPPRDLLLQPDFITTSFESAKSLDVEIPVLVGTPVPSEHERNLPANGVVRSGLLNSSPNGENTNRVVAKKQLLPSYDVFDETRYFSPANRSGICRSIGEIDLGVTVCEDAWQAAGLTPSSYGQDPIESLAEWGRQGVTLDATVNLSASPYHADKVSSRVKVCRTAAQILATSIFVSKPSWSERRFAV